MEIIDILDPTMVVANLKANSKKQALQELAGLAARATNLEERALFDVFSHREKLGSTGLGGGIAIPHGKIAGMSGIVGAFAKIAKPIQFDAVDDQPVDLFFMLLAAEGSGAEHLKALSRVARIFRDQETVAALRAADDADMLYQILIGREKASAA